MNITKAIKRDRKIKRRKNGRTPNGKEIKKQKQIDIERERKIRNDHYTDK